RGEPEQDGTRRQGRGDGGGEGLRVRGDGQPGEGRVDEREGVVGLEEEVAGEAHVGEPAVAHLQVDDDELAAGDLELSVHGNASLTGTGHGKGSGYRSLY